jgi:hypothetical protein
MSLLFNVHLDCSTAGCGHGRQHLVLPISLTAILQTSCDGCGRRLHLVAVQHNNVRIEILNDISEQFVLGGELHILDQLKRVFEQARGVAYHAYALLEFRTIRYASRSIPIHAVAETRKTS